MLARLPRQFFYQIKLAIHCLWYSGIMIVNPVTRAGVLIVELGMAMGFTPCSNIAQMICDALLYIFDEMMEEEEVAADDMDVSLRQLLERRAELHGNKHGRAWTSRGYTDDCLQTVIGAARWARGIRVWQLMLRLSGVRGASCGKRQAGTHVLFLGVTLLATALIAYVTEVKRMRALLALALLLEGKLSKEEAQRLFGLLVHLAFLAPFGKQSSTGLWECLSEKRFDPVQLRQWERETAERWVCLLQHTAAAHMDRGLRRSGREREPIRSQIVSTNQSDAYNTDKKVGGMGGYAHGDLWRADLYGALLRGPISATEMLAFYVHLIMNAAAHSVADVVDHFVDNANAFQAMAREGAKSPFNRWLYREIVESEAYKAVAHKLRIAHRWGVWLLLADAASRNYVGVIDDVANKARLSFTWLKLSSAASAVVAKAERKMGEFLDESADDGPSPPRPLARAPGGRRPWSDAVLALAPAAVSGCTGGTAISTVGVSASLSSVAVVTAAVVAGLLLVVWHTRAAKHRAAARVFPSAVVEQPCSAPSPTPSPPDVAPAGASARRWPHATSGELIAPFTGVCEDDQCHCLVAEYGAVVHVQVGGIHHLALLSKLFVTRGAHEVLLWSASPNGGAGGQRVVRVDVSKFRLWQPHDGRPLVCPGCGGDTDSFCDFDSADNTTHRCGAFQCREEMGQLTQPCGLANSSQCDCTALGREVPVEDDVDVMGLEHMRPAAGADVVPLDAIVQGANLLKVRMARNGGCSHNEPRVSTVEGAYFVALSLKWAVHDGVYMGVLMPDGRKHRHPQRLRVAMADTEVVESSSFAEATALALAEAWEAAESEPESLELRRTYLTSLRNWMEGMHVEGEGNWWLALYAGQQAYQPYVGRTPNDVMGLDYDDVEAGAERREAARLEAALMQLDASHPQPLGFGVRIEQMEEHQDVRYPERVWPDGSKMCACARPSPYGSCVEDVVVANRFCVDCATVTCQHSCACECMQYDGEDCVLQRSAPLAAWHEVESGMTRGAFASDFDVGQPFFAFTGVASTTVAGVAPAESSLTTHERAYQHRREQSRRREAEALELQPGMAQQWADEMYAEGPELQNEADALEMAQVYAGERYVADAEPSRAAASDTPLEQEVLKYAASSTSSSRRVNLLIRAQEERERAARRNRRHAQQESERALRDDEVLVARRRDAERLTLTGHDRVLADAERLVAAAHAEGRRSTIGGPRDAPANWHYVVSDDEEASDSRLLADAERLAAAARAFPRAATMVAQYVVSNDEQTSAAFWAEEAHHRTEQRSEQEFLRAFEQAQRREDDVRAWLGGEPTPAEASEPRVGAPRVAPPTPPPSPPSRPGRVVRGWTARRAFWLLIAAVSSAVAGATAPGPTALLSVTGLAAVHARPPSLGKAAGASPSTILVGTAAAATVAAAGWRTFKPKAPIRKVLVPRSGNAPLMPPAAQAQRRADQERQANEPLVPPRRQESAMSLPVGRRTGGPTAQWQPDFDSSLVCHPDPDSVYALQPLDGGVYLRRVMQRVQQSIDYGVNKNTKAGEKSAWSKYYSPYCKLMRTAEWRGFEAVNNAAHETSFTCGFAMHVWTCMQPRRKTDKAPRVDSVRNVLGHIRRSHARRGFPTAEWSMVGHMLKGLTLQRIADFGLALAERAEPFTATENIAMKHLPNRVGGRVCDVSTRFWANWLMVDTYADQAGPRKSEIVGTAVIGFTRADVQFTVDGVTYSDPSPEVLRSFTNDRDSVTVAVNVSKADYDGSRFGNSLVSLLYNTENKMSFAVACVTYELLFPLRGLQRYKTPLFTPDGVKPWKESQIDGTLRAVMAATLTPQQRVGKTFHSKRAWVATALRALKASDAEIQAFVRWSSPESLKLYARWDLIYQARRRDELSGAHVTSLNTVRRGLIEPTLADVESMRSIADDMINAE